MALFIFGPGVSVVSHGAWCLPPLQSVLPLEAKSNHEAADADELGILLGDMHEFQQRNEIAI